MANAHCLHITPITLHMYTFTYILTVNPRYLRTVAGKCWEGASHVSWTHERDISPPCGRYTVIWSTARCRIEPVWILHNHNSVQRWRRCHRPSESVEEYWKNYVPSKDQVTNSPWPTTMLWTSFVKTRRVSFPATALQLTLAKLADYHYKLHGKCVASVS